jgi:hypothetical protein
MYLSPKRNFFVVDVLSPGGNWNGRQRVVSRKEWDSVFESQISVYLEYLEVNEQRAL